MKIEIISRPTATFMKMLMNNINPMHRESIPSIRWSAVGLVQATLIELYCSADLAEKVSDVKTALVSGNCPQHIQMLAVLGNQAAVNTAMEKIQNYYTK